MSLHTFTMEDALNIQKLQLEEWKSILKPEKYELLQSYVNIINKSVTIADKVFRGVDMNNWVHNNLMEKKNY